MAKREEFLCAWRTRFSVTDIPTDVVECLQSSNNKQLRKILKTCQAKVTELQNELQNANKLQNATIIGPKVELGSGMGFALL